MGRRGYRRFRVEVPVTVSGLDTNGNPFTQSATTVEISARGLRLRGITCLRGRRGELLQVKYKQRSARYRVAWIEETAIQGLIGLESLEDANYIFADRMPADFAIGGDARCDSYEVPAVDRNVAATDASFDVSPALAERCKSDRQQEERRHHPRFACTGTARLWEQGQELAIGARVNEISLGGCYIEIMSPMRLDTAVRLELVINRRTLSLEGVVRNSQPNFGMGIEFLKIAPAEAEKLQRVVGELSGTLTPETAAPPASLSSALPDTLEDAVMRWFGSHDALTRKEFQELKEEVAHRQHQLTHAP